MGEIVKSIHFILAEKPEAQEPLAKYGFMEENYHDRTHLNPRVVNAYQKL
jgi:hypothetical protein